MKPYDSVPLPVIERPEPAYLEANEPAIVENDASLYFPGR